MTEQSLINNTNKPLSRNLNESQQAAVDYRAGHLLIVAGPGTGKTHTLIHRISHLVDETDGQQGVLAITFTNKAALEMRERLNVQSLENDRMFVGTFHQFCLKLVLEYSDLLDLPEQFTVADPHQILEYYAHTLPNLSKRQIKDRLNEISQFKSELNADQMPAELMEYSEILCQNRCIDFDDVLLKALELFEAHESVRSVIHSRYTYVFVDEYQDINAVQHALLKELVGDISILTAIGDPNQAIYGFRGSDVRYFDSFVQDFPEAHVLELSDNYRSGRNILSASSQVITIDNKFKVPELTANLYSAGRLTIHQALTQKAEAEYVVHQIERLIGGTSMFSQDSGRVSGCEEVDVSFGDIAVLYRLNSQRHALVTAFDRSGIPYEVSVKSADDDMDDVCPSRYISIDSKCEKVSLMSIHASKGLEFSVVFMVGCEEKLIPLDLINLSSDVAEERRLFYVGMTRAKHYLYLVNAQRRILFGESYAAQPSRFLRDIEEDLKNYQRNEMRVKKSKKSDQQLNLF